MGNTCCTTSRMEEFDNQVSKFEQTTMPLTKVRFHDFEERVKRLVFADHDDSISMAQLEESFRSEKTVSTYLAMRGSIL